MQQGTQKGQRVVTGQLSTFADKVSLLDIKPPTLIIIGHVVKLRQELVVSEQSERTQTMTQDTAQNETSSQHVYESFI